MTAFEGTLDVAVDNDVLLKAVSYRLSSAFWPGLGTTTHMGVLGAARYVVSGQLERTRLAGDKDLARAELASLLSLTIAMEPMEGEVRLAAEIEFAAAQAGVVGLDAGEAQLMAMAIERVIPILETGDKRAIRATEELLDVSPRLGDLIGKVRCLEQIALDAIADATASVGVAEAICAEPDVDTALAICFGCYSPKPPERQSIREGLDSYIGEVRRAAPRLLAN